MKLNEITLKDLFDKLLGKELAGKFAKEVDEGLEKGLKGKELQKHMQTVWNKYKDKAKTDLISPQQQDAIIAAAIIIR
jgi:hypothetical protein